jgi:hypothetical protein
MAQQVKFYGITIITIANFGYREFLLNWLMHMRKQKYSKFVVFSFDQALVEFLAREGYVENVILVPSKWLVYKLTANFSKWGEETYKHIVKSKTSVCYHLLVRNHSFVFSDPDVVWLSEHVIEHIKFQHDHSFAEILFSQETLKGMIICNTGFFYATATPFVIALFSEMLYLQHYNDTAQQPIWHSILKATRFNDTRVGKLDLLLYANGLIYFNHKLNQKIQIRPLIVHATYVIGSAAKINLLKSEDYWLL